MRSKSGTVREIRSEHQLSKLRGYAARRVAETKKEVANSGGNSAAKAATDARPSTEATTSIRPAFAHHLAS